MEGASGVGIRAKTSLLKYKSPIQNAGASAANYLGLSRLRLEAGSTRPTVPSKIKHLLSGADLKCFSEESRWEARGKDEGRFLRLRQTLALPIYAIALVMDFA